VSAEDISSLRDDLKRVHRNAELIRARPGGGAVILIAPLQ
jgi:hypothetical protein